MTLKTLPIVRTKCGEGENNAEEPKLFPARDFNRRRNVTANGAGNSHAIRIVSAIRAENRFTKEQKKKLEELYFEFQQYSVRREADLNVADAELRRLLVTDRVDLAAVGVKVKEVEAVQS